MLDAPFIVLPVLIRLLLRLLSDPWREVLSFLSSCLTRFYRNLWTSKALVIMRSLVISRTDF